MPLGSVRMVSAPRHGQFGADRGLCVQSKTTGYVARFGFDRHTVLRIVVCIAMAAAFFWYAVAGDSNRAYRNALGYRVLVFGVALLLVVMALWFIAMATLGAVALRVDEDGITLGHPHAPSPHRRLVAHPVHVPWDDLAEVVLFLVYVPIPRREWRHAKVPHLGLRRRPGAQGSVTTVEPDMYAQAVEDAPSHVPEDVYLLSRPIFGWRLDEARLCVAIAAYAPDVAVVLVDRSGASHRVCPNP